MTASKDHFVLGEEFQYDHPYVPQYLSDNFRDWYVLPSLNKVVSLKLHIPVLADYTMPSPMSDDAVHQVTGSRIMNEDTFSQALYMFIIEPELGVIYLGHEFRKDNTYYIVHARLDDGKEIAVGIRWRGDAWYCFAIDYNVGNAWPAGSIFLYIP